jgi:hypothetical protein
MDHGLQKDLTVKEVTQTLKLALQTKEEISFLLKSTMEIPVFPLELNLSLLVHLPTMIINLPLLGDILKTKIGL